VCCAAELEDDEEHVINWSVEITDVLGSRLYAVWNRTAGDCLLDSVLQASWGVMDRDNTLRRALADSLGEAAFTYVFRRFIVVLYFGTGVKLLRFSALMWLFGDRSGIRRVKYCWTFCLKRKTGMIDKNHEL